MSSKRNKEDFFEHTNVVRTEHYTHSKMNTIIFTESSYFISVAEAQKNLCHDRPTEIESFIEARHRLYRHYIS